MRGNKNKLKGTENKAYCQATIFKIAKNTIIPIMSLGTTAEGTFSILLPRSKASLTLTASLLFIDEILFQNLIKNNQYSRAI